MQFFLLAFSLHLIVYGSIKPNDVGEVEGAAQQRGRGVRHVPYGLQDDAQQRGRDILVACNEAADTFFSRDRNVASPLCGEDLGMRHILHVIPFPHVGIGQDDDWVRVNFTNAADILAVGYANWVDAQVGIDLTNGLYKFTATFHDDPPEATELIVGDFSVCVTNAGEYAFLLAKGEEYALTLEPFSSDITFTAVDDITPPMILMGFAGESNDHLGHWPVDDGELQLLYPTFASAGRIWWMPKFCGSPDVAHFGPYSGAKTFTAQLSDYRYAEAVAYHWTCDDENVVIVSPNSRETTITFATMPSWRAATLTVTATVGTNELRSALAGFTYGTNDTPQVHFSFSVPDAVKAFLMRLRIPVRRLHGQMTSLAEGKRSSAITTPG